MMEKEIPESASLTSEPILSKTTLHVTVYNITDNVLTEVNVHFYLVRLMYRC